MMNDMEFILSLFDEGRKNTNTGNWTYDIDDFQGRTAQKVYDLFVEYLNAFIAEIEIYDDIVDVTFWLNCCPNAEDDEDF